MLVSPTHHRSTVINSFTGSAEGDPSYVLSLATDASERVAAVAGSEFDVRLYDRETLRLLGTAGAPAHQGRINEVCFGPAAAPLLYTASSDGTIKAWDCAAGGAASPAATLRERREEVWCVSASTGHLIAAGAQNAVLIWDMRNASKPVCRWEVHTEEVSQVRFQPGSDHVLLSGSVDGLICGLDCRCDATLLTVRCHPVPSRMIARAVAADAKRPAWPDTVPGTRGRTRR